ncbi:MAG: VWA domain-containing protein [Deltaproteobacteria bacterium]|nr:VWA domain-containing protein [Deltaproteobacteria bacterium]
MEILTPWGLAALGLLAPLVALYLLKRRRVRQEVPSLRPWRAVALARERHAGLQRLRSRLSLWLHALAVALVALALAGPFRRSRVEPSSRLVLVVDTTASLGARDPRGGTRLDRAKEAALAALEAQGPRGEVALVEAGCAPAVRVPPTRDRVALRRALHALRPRGCGGDLAAALPVAADRLRGASGSRRVVVITDGTTRAERLGEDLPAVVELRYVGAPTDNVGVTGLSLREDGEDAGVRRYAVFVGLWATAPCAAALRLEAWTPRGTTLVALRRARLSAGRASFTLPVTFPEGGAPALLRATVAREDGAPDGLSEDDRAWAPVPPSARLPVRVVTPRPGGSPWVLRALRADPGVSAEEVQGTPAVLQASTMEVFNGLTVFHGIAPEAAVPGEALFLGPSGARAGGFVLGLPVRGARLTDASPTDPRARFVPVGDVHPLAVRSVTAEPGDVTLVGSTAGPAALARDTTRGSSTLVAFDPDRSDWPLRASWVLFLRNAVEHARASLTASGLDATRTGSVVRMPALGVERVTVTALDPPGRRWSLPVQQGAATWVETDATGVYRVDRGRGEEHLGLGLLDATESALGRASLPWRGAVVAEPSRGAQGTTELGWLLALAALALVVTEWLLARPMRVRGSAGSVPTTPLRDGA